MRKSSTRSAALSLVLILCCGVFAFATKHGQSDFVISAGVLLISWAVLGLHWRRRRDDDER
jgi:protein-S-isoprenylcysteine O-methyltransferase Ste14